MKKHHIIASILYVLLLLILSLYSPAYASDDSFESSVKEWQVYYEDFFKLYENRSYVWDWEAFPAEHDKLDYWLQFGDIDTINDFAVCFTKSKRDSAVYSIFVFCYVYPGSWNNAVFNDVIQKFIYSNVYAVNDYKYDAEVHKASLDFFECIYGYRDYSNTNAEYELVGDYGRCAISYGVAPSDNEPDFVMLSIYTY